MCRNISCHNGRCFDQEGCSLWYNSKPPHPCMSTYLKLTLVQDTTVSGQRLTTRRYIEDIWNTLVHYSSATLVKMEIFANSDWYNAVDFVDYFVVRVVFLTEDILTDWKGVQKEDILLNIVSKTHHKLLISGMHYDTLYSEMTMYEF